MNLLARFFRFLVILSLAAAPCVLAQRPHAASPGKTAPGTWDIANDVSLQGTVISFTENSETLPIGAHLLLQTSSGNVDVHLGDARLLRLAKMNLAPGMSVRIVGQSQPVSQNTVFLARLVQVGTQLLAVRSDHGFPLSPASLSAKDNKDQGGAR